MNLTNLQEYKQPCTIFFRVRMFFPLCFNYTAHGVLISSDAMGSAMGSEASFTSEVLYHNENSPS